LNDCLSSFFRSASDEPKNEDIWRSFGSPNVRLHESLFMTTIPIFFLLKASRISPLKKQFNWLKKNKYQKSL